MPHTLVARPLKLLYRLLALKNKFTKGAYLARLLEMLSRQNYGRHNQRRYFWPKSALGLTLLSLSHTQQLTLSPAALIPTPRLRGLPIEARIARIRAAPRSRGVRIGSSELYFRTRKVGSSGVRFGSPSLVSCRSLIWSWMRFGASGSFGLGRC